MPPSWCRDIFDLFLWSKPLPRNSMFDHSIHTLKCADSSRIRWQLESDRCSSSPFFSTLSERMEASSSLLLQEFLTLCKAVGGSLALCESTPPRTCCGQQACVLNPNQFPQFPLNSLGRLHQSTRRRCWRMRKRRFSLRSLMANED